MSLFATGLCLGILAGCTAPIKVDRVSIQQSYAQVASNALRTGKPSALTLELLHRYELDRLAARQPDEAVRQLHRRAMATGERELLFALAELSYVAGGHIRQSVKPWDPRDARDYYLGSAVYAWLFLFGQGKEALPSPFDRRFREACDFYNLSLGLALTERRSTNGVVQLQNSRRRLPVGELDLQLDCAHFSSRLEDYDQVLLADQCQVRGLSVRNRSGGVGTPLVCVGPLNPEFGVRLSAPATVLLRGPASLAELASGPRAYSLELYSAYDATTITVGDAPVPLERDVTTFRAYTLSQSRVWKLGQIQFLSPAKRIRSQLIPNQPLVPDRIPIVFVHGTFSSPVTWAELGNSLAADPVLCQRYQTWSFIYGSGNPLLYSVADLRDALTAQVRQLDPAGTNVLLRQMVIIGHSQGGLLAKGTAIDAGDRLWHQLSPSPLESLKLSEEQQAELRRLLFLEPLPFVKRVVFIATPHRGSYLASGFARRLAYQLISLPGALVSRSKDLLKLSTGTEAVQFLRGRIPTSLDGMSPRNPGLLAMADIPVSESIKAHSIIPVLGNDDYRQGRDGLVSYQSAHVEYVESECIVRSPHSCLNQPATIGEVRRILHEHLSSPK